MKKLLIAEGPFSKPLSGNLAAYRRTRNHPQTLRAQMMGVDKETISRLTQR